MLSFKTIPAVCLRREKTQNPQVACYVSSSMFGTWSSPVFSNSFSQSLTLLFTCLYKPKLMHADPTICLKPLDRLDRRFESRWVHSCSSLVLVVCYVGSDLCDGWSLVQRSPNWCVCVRGSLIVCDLEISKRGDWDPIWVVVPQKKNWRCPRILIWKFFPQLLDQLRGSTNLLF